MPLARLHQLLVLVLVTSCSNVPSGVLFRCEPDGSCPSSNLRCVSIDGEKYCVPLDGGATAGGSSGGATAGGSAGGVTAGGSAGGSTAGGSAGGATAGGSAGGATAGGSAGGSTAGGSAGGATAGGSAGGAMAGGSAGGAMAGGSAGGATAGGSAGGATAGGSAGGSMAGGSAGGATAGGSAGGATAGGSAGGSTAGGSAGGMTAGGGADGGSRAGGSAGGMTAGGAAGGMTAGGSAGGGFVYPAMAVIPNSRFIGIAQIAIGGPPVGAAVATVREPLDAGVSILEGWASNGSATPVQSRQISWASAYRVTAIASNTSDTAIAVQSSSGVSIEEVQPASNFGTVGFTNLEAIIGASDAGVSRLSMLPVGTAAPMLAFVQGGGVGNVRLYRLSTGAFSTLSYQPGAMSAVAFGDDLIDSPPPGSASSRLLMTVRCPGSCSIAGSSVTTTGLGSRFAWMLYSPATNALGMTPVHAALVSANSMPVFSSTERVRAASDGNTFVYFAGLGLSGNLLVERRDATTGVTDSLFSSTGTLQLVDLRRSPTGAAVLVLATYQSASSFAGTLPFTLSNQRNVVVIRIDSAGSVTASSFDLPGDQQAVGFAGGGNGYLYIAINEGPNAVLWRIPDL